MVSQVSQFYDANTWRFLLFGSGQAIHRELYGPGVDGRAAALDFAHHLIDQQLDHDAWRTGGRVLDLGCGVGAAMRYLAARSDASFVGVTISPRQVALARRLAAPARSADRAPHPTSRLRFVEGDFCQLPPDISGFDLAFSIEAYVHAPSAGQYFSNAATALRPGGRLVVIDDFLAGDPKDSALQTVRAYWHYDNLLTVSDAVAQAAAAGLRLIGDRDLSGYQLLGRPRDRLIRACQPLLRRVAPYNRWCQMLVGGNALQDVLGRGLVQYRELVFTRV